MYIKLHALHSYNSKLVVTDRPMDIVPYKAAIEAKNW